MITVAAYCTPNFEALAAVTVPSVRRYCDRHGYGHRIWNEESQSVDDRPFGFRKTECALETLRAMAYGDDLLFVIDLDLLVTNHTIRLESFIDNEHDIFATHDQNGLNSGAYLIRHTLGTEKFLEDVISRWGQPGVFGEQDAMRDALRIEAFGNLLKVLPQSAFNSYLYGEYGAVRTHQEGQWKRGDFALHLPGMSNERRIDLFTSPEIQGAIVE